MTVPRRTLILTFLIIVLCNIFTARCNIFSGDAVPVLLWGSSPEFDFRPSAVNPLSKTSQAEFNQILNSKTDNLQPPLLVFVKDSLCVEDLTQHKEDLRQVTNRSLLAYLPAVENPLSVFEDFPSYNRSYDDNVDSVSDSQLVIKPITTLDAISEIYRSIKDSSPNLIAALTGRSCSYSRSERIRRATVDNNSDTYKSKDFNPNASVMIYSCNISKNSNEFIVRGEKVLLYGSQLPSIKIKDMDFKNLSSITSCKEILDQFNNINLTLTFNGIDNNMEQVVLDFNIKNPSSGYYSMKSVIYKPNNANPEVLTSKLDIVFPFNFSYHCSNEIIFSENTTILKIPNMQIQVDAKKFGDAYDCVNFTTIPIWTGIFVTAMLGSIMIWAIIMIMDIRTMDRFDDPKGKTITISALE
ncbi:V-type proton ATPase subunit S1 [Vespula pensylvanica]|uniref:V-type proton ATPase subunit S1 n=1 Tax=Vespula pensylvanica TaxID=30213 RepID=UPI001CB9EE36|nr:V-type proton ATPase subunit S1 [Vespula pensylvanica]